ncbi:tetratricopeptide repeat protein [Glacieibacterium frigidum]|uniref:Tetratricopeptide repeat protein n=1 Tax=Glacieibacterium frigidum TaxID=2593303 RepID=A0A552U7Q4_9SPHN|nr:tetratricopeptide repeat protein [Glacieibacterium frigidum]TRW14199.1 tetratricopeptide repeat protein [Glacieibacterium frigidum]
MATDFNALFARAEAAFRAARWEAARADLHTVLRGVGDHPAVLHLLALVEQNAGRLPAARTMFERALAVAPDDPQINNNYGNLLDAVEEYDAALRHYGRAILKAPDFLDARLNRATTQQKLGNYTAALIDLDVFVARHPDDARVWEARGAVQRLAGNRLAARTDFQRALDLDPGRPTALHGVARTALELSDDAAVPLYRAALAADPNDPEVALGLAEALEAAGDADCVPTLEAAVARNPQWVAGQDSLSRMRAEADAPGDYVAYYAAAAQQFPADRDLALGYARALARGNRRTEALAFLDGAAGRIGADAEVRLMQAVLASEAGDLDRADGEFARAGSDTQAQLARGRHMLRRDPEAAARILEPLTRAEPGLVGAWAHLGLAWRLIGDPRFDWLCRPGMWRAHDLEIGDERLARLADVLRGLHRTRAHPIGQSLRGGTQTRGRLFDRPEPELKLLHDELDAAVAAHFAALPPHDASHPLLRHRHDALRIEGSWSVRLTGGGFHVNHIHPLGVLSSACYIGLPAADSGDPRAGWLSIGSPPDELALDLAPLGLVEPRPGRLALFPSYLFHGTLPFATGERLTVAFDVIA